jgi:hypothetical protein
MAEPLARSSFRNRELRGRRGILLAALGASAALSFASIGVATAAGARTRVHLAMRDAPPLAHTGGFGEPTCLSCHGDGDLNEPGGTLAIEGLPARYQPGQRYALTVVITHPQLRVAGFELSARFESGPDSARQAGMLSATGDSTAVSVDEASRVQYAHHLRPGTTPRAPGRARWTVTWTAPASASGPIVFHAAANGANDNDSPTGDYIYARPFRVPTAEKE